VEYDVQEHQAYDKNTGKRVSIHTKLASQSHYDFEWGHRTLGTYAIYLLGSYNLTGRELYTFIWLAARSHRGNIVGVTGHDATQGLNMNRHQFSRVMAKLAALRLLRKHTERGMYSINPHFIWNGSASEQNQGIVAWDTHDRVVQEITDLAPNRKGAS
jgi:hypothetical protein